MLEKLRIPRVAIAAGGTHVFPAAVIVGGPYENVRIAIDISDADQLDPTKVVSLTLEYSETGEDPWERLVFVRTSGENVPERQAKLGHAVYGKPWTQVRCPPNGYRVRGTVQVGESAVSVGLILMAE